MFRGHIKVWRKITEWEWYTKSNMLHLFLHLLLKANYKDKSWRGKDIKRGQYWTSIKQLSLETGISEQSIRTALKNLELSGEITDESTNEGRLLTLNNYETYNTPEISANKPTNEQDNKPLTNGQQTPNKPLTTTNKDNKDNHLEEGKEENKDIPSLQDLRDGFINFATDYFKESNEGYDYNRLKLEADEFAHYWLDAKKGCKTQWEKKKRCDIKATARSRFTDRVGKIKTYGTDTAVNYDPPKPEKIKTPEEIAWEKEQSAKLKKKTEELKAKIKADQERDKNDKPEYKQVPREESLALLNRLGE